MKTRILSAPRCGSVLLSTLVIALLVGIVVGALLFVARQQNYFAYRSNVWCSEIPIAEAGIEEAMAHINSRATMGWAVNGWSLSGSNFVKTRVMGDDYFYTAISTTRPPTIISVGYGRIPKQTNYMNRTVLVQTRSRVNGLGVISKTTTTIVGSAFINSFDSSDPLYSTGGLYDPTKPKDGAIVATTSGLRPAIDTGGGEIFGYAATGPGGTAVGNVGSGTYLASSGGIQTDHFRDDFNMAIPDVTEPYSGGLPLPPIALGIYVLPTGDYISGTALTLNGGNTILITGKVRLYFKADFTIAGGGELRIAPGASLEIYLGAAGKFGGNGIVNGTLTAENCAIYGLPTCTTLDYNGGSGFIGTVYAPSADAKFAGSSDASGSFVANSFTTSGGMNIHYDEALGRKGAVFQISSWRER